MNSLVNLEQRVFLKCHPAGWKPYRLLQRNRPQLQYGKRIQHKEQHHSGLRPLRHVRTEYASLPDFSWKGYEHKDLETIDPLYLNAQGDKGNVMLAVVNPIIELNLSSHFKANMEVSYYYRHTHYSYHEDIKYKTFETRLGLIYQF